MKNLTTIFFAFCFLLVATAAFAQQQPHNTQFMYYKLGYNPAYAGSRETPCVTCIYRQQWLGLDGAPTTQAITFTMPLMNQRVGIGANLYRHTIGITTIYNFDAAYAYRMRLGNGMLGIGIMGSTRSYQNDFGKTTATQDKNDDPSIPVGSQNKIMFNFGTGLYYNTENFYFGVSVPRLLENNIDFTSDDVEIAREVQHIYLMGGWSIKLNDNLKLQPQGLVKYVAHAPVGIDLNTSLLIQNHYVVGVTYRVGGDRQGGPGNSLDLLVAAQLTKSLMFGFSYDYTLSDIKDHQSGSVEASLHYCIGSSKPGKEYVNPRFF